MSGHDGGGCVGILASPMLMCGTQWALDQSNPTRILPVLGWMEILDSSLPARMQWGGGPGSLWVPGWVGILMASFKAGLQPVSSQLLADADTDGSFPPSPWAQPKELRKPLERGPQRQPLEVIIFLRLFFFFSPANCGVDIVPSHERLFCEPNCWAKPGLGSRLQAPGRLLHISLGGR